METKLLDQSKRHRSFHTGIFRALLIAFVAVQLMACGGGGSGASGTGTDSVAQSVVTPADSTGSGSSTNSTTTTDRRQAYISWLNIFIFICGL